MTDDSGLVQIWERPQGPCPPYVPGMQHCHIGSKAVVEGMWQRLGTSMDWSLAIHPYGNPSMVAAAFSVSGVVKARAALMQGPIRGTFRVSDDVS